MNIGGCSREKEVMELLKSGRWAASSDPELRAHAQACRICRDLIAVRSAFQVALGQAREEAPLNSAGVLFWRAQLRQRYEAVERVSRPIAGAHRFALVLNILVAVMSAVWLARHADLWREWFEDAHAPNLSAGASLFHHQALLSFNQLVQNANLAVVIPCAAAIALLGGVVVYLAADRS